MTEREIQLLGFERFIEDSDPEVPFHYYTYTIATGFSFISNSSDETENGDWYVEFFDSDPCIRFHKFEEVQSLINLLEKRIIDDK